VKFEAVVIGVSAGGVEALSVILVRLPAEFFFPIIIVQHRHPSSDDFLVCLLNEKCKTKVEQADEKENIVPGIVYIAPANYHLMVEEDRTFSLSVDEHVNYTRPSIDVLFETAADVYRERLVGVVLTGANSDGSQGLRKIKELGGMTVVQDPATAEAAFMPKSAIAATKVDHIIPLEEIGPFLEKLNRQ